MMEAPRDSMRSDTAALGGRSSAHYVLLIDGKLGNGP